MKHYNNTLRTRTAKELMNVHYIDIVGKRCLRVWNYHNEIELDNYGPNGGVSPCAVMTIEQAEKLISELKRNIKIAKKWGTEDK